MFKPAVNALFAMQISLGARPSGASAEGICWDGSVIRDMKDCPKRPGDKLRAPSSGNDQGSSVAPKLPALHSNAEDSAGAPLPSETPSFNFSKMDISPPPAGGSTSPPPPPPPKTQDDCMSCAD